MGPVYEPGIVSLVTDHVGEIHVPVGEACPTLKTILIRRYDLEEFRESLRINGVKRHFFFGHVGKGMGGVLAKPLLLFRCVNCELPVWDHP